VGKVQRVERVELGLTFYERRKLVDPRIGKRDVFDREKQKDHMAVYNCTRWHRLRDKMMALCPVCPDPFGQHRDRVVLSIETHHIVPLSAGLGGEYDERNLIPLCRSCHKLADKMDEDRPQAQRRLMMDLRAAI
jgi:5-methylcytosine-specific restriction endonuclease McrA